MDIVHLLVNRSESNTTTETPEDPSVYTEFPSVFPQDSFRITFVKIVCPTVLAVGTIGNIMALIVLLNQEVRMMPSTPYFRTLAVSDLMVLYSSAIHAWLSYGFSIDITVYHNVICKVRLYFIYMFSHISAWMIVAVTVDRFVCITLPFKAREIRKKHRLAVIAGIIFFFFALNFHFLIGKTIKLAFKSDGTAFYICGDITDGYMYFSNYAGTWIDYMAYTIIPLCIFIVCDVGMITSLIRSGSDIKYADESGDVSKTRDSAKRLIKLLFAITISFVVLTSGICVVQIYEGYWPNIHLPQERAKYNLARAVVIQLYYLNHAINFFLYCLTGPKFRLALKSMFRCK